MKKLRLTFLVVVLMVATVASAQLSWGVQGGLNLSNIVINNDFTSPKPKIGFNAGILTDFGITHNMGIRSGLFFTTKGFRIGEFAMENILGIHTTPQQTINLMYLQIPVHFARKVDVTPDTRIVFHGGPYVAYGIGGSWRVGNERTEHAVFGSNGYKPFDFGFGGGVGFEFGHNILINIGWDMGLLNISTQSQAGESIRTQNAFLAVGYRF